MHLIDGAGHINNSFAAEDAQTARPPTEITADIMNALQWEIANAITGMGVSLDKGNNHQLGQSLANTYARKDGSIHYIRQVWDIVADRPTLDSVPVAGLANGTVMLVTSYYGPYQAALVTLLGGVWVAEPTPLNVFDLYGTDHDNHGYYWFSGSWNLFDVTTMQIDEATEEASGILRLATFAQVMARSLEAIALRPKHMADYIDRQFVGSVADFTGTTPPGDVWLPANGQLVTRASYPLLWDYANSRGNIVDDSQWSSNTGRYSRGDGSTTLRLPDLRGEFRRGWDNGRGVDVGRVFGAVQQDRCVMLQDGGYSAPNTQYTAKGYLASPFNGAEGHAVVYQVVGDPRYFAGYDTRPRNLAYLTCIYAGAPA